MKIKITEDPDCDMLQITTEDGQCLFEGNYSDFSRNAAGFAKLFELMNIDVSVDIKSYDDWY